MINWGSGYFLGLKLGFILIILGIEFYFIVFEKWIEKDISYQEMTIFSLLFIISIMLTILKISLISIFIPLSGYIFIHFLQEKKEKKITEKSEIRRINELKDIISQQPNNYKAYIELGDIYFKKEEYSQALQFYKTAYRIKDLPLIRHKILVSEKENRRKEGVIWICRNCGEENAQEQQRCKNCGEEKDVIKSIAQDIKETKKYIIFLLILPIIVLLIFIIIKFLPLYFSLMLFLFILYLVFKFFLIP
ncbi:MAG: hypothetical protein NC827_00910 [Candidatus Omnitrophica bacterium]|nr:hypothetical protein [Candidatus Omnitrophota bacterium]MCM8801862.1 hypothetical protein [Candidatus Omnitrophota bacterium]